jgi:probable O-glycosylation ligase (exosortase A-associated)
MRDILVVGIVIFGSLAALRRPWIGILVWTWLSIMNPHRLAWGFAYDAPLAAVAAGTTLVGTLLTAEREWPFKGGAVTVLLLFMGWITLSWIFGLDPATDYWQWNKVMKIDMMIIVALMLLRTKQHIFALMWVTTASLALLGAKGGLFTLMTGGGYRVWGPPGSFIEDNNEFALALVMTIPLIRFLQLQLPNALARHGMTVLMLLCAASALGSQSRGALIAIGAMSLLLWWRGRNRIVGGILMVVAGLALVAFMPDTWSTRMSTISTYDQDSSALGRISAWWNAWNLAFHYPLGVGFDAARPELFAKYSPYPDDVHAAHSIYFQVLGNHGFFGLFLFLLLWVLVYRSAGWLRTRRRELPEEARWCADLGALCQVSLIGYAVGGAFLSLSYFDLPYDILVLVMLTRTWVGSKAWEREPVYARSWKTIPGLAPPLPKPR